MPYVCLNAVPARYIGATYAVHKKGGLTGGPALGAAHAALDLDWEAVSNLLFPADDIASQTLKYTLL